ncbi:histone-lysine N-methyltransferase SETMAR [Trichonephila clavipes]|nr:histone-lysine N-methyltransferase SETMAR [Trichonephila clavipes]
MFSQKESLLKRHEKYPFLKRIITGDEKWDAYNNVKRKRSWSKKDEPAQTISKADIHQKKLDKLNDALQQKRSELINRKGVVFNQGNARPHTSLVTRQKLLQLEWDTMLYAPYSPDLAPSDYYLFRSLQNFLDGLDMCTVTSPLPVTLSGAFHTDVSSVRKKINMGNNTDGR